jgi:hypothetical protein
VITYHIVKIGKLPGNLASEYEGQYATHGREWETKIKRKWSLLICKQAKSCVDTHLRNQKRSLPAFFRKSTDSLTVEIRLIHYR